MKTNPEWPAQENAGNNLILNPAARRAAIFTVVARSEGGSSRPSPSVRRFIALLNAGINAWRDAAIFFVRQSNNNPGFRRDILSCCPSITAEMLDSIERVGRGKIIPQFLMIDSRPGIKPMLNWSIETQHQYLTKPIEVLVDDEVKLILAQNLSRSQCKQVFCAESIRNIKEQRQWLYNRKAARPKWSLVGNRIFGLTKWKH